MKILEVHKFYYLKRGAEKHFFDVIALLKNTGNDVRIFTMNDKKNIPSDDKKYFVSRVGYRKGFNFLERFYGILRLFWSCEARKKIQLFINDFKPDLVHVHNIYHQISPSILPVVKKNKVPLVMTVHDFHLVSPDHDYYDKSIGKKYWKFLFTKRLSFGERFLLIVKLYWEDFFGFYKKNIDLYIVPSIYVKTILVSHGFDVKKIIVLPHFIKHTCHDDEDNKLKKHLILPEKFALYIGQVSMAKNVEYLVQTFHNQKRHLILAGALTSGIKIPRSTYIHYIGYQNQGKLCSLLKQASFCVSASHHETFGLTALESLAHGKPFIGFSGTGFDTIILSEKYGLLAKDNDSFNKNIKDVFEKKIIFNSNELKAYILKNFSSEFYSEKLESLFKKLTK